MNVCTSTNEGQKSNGRSKQIFVLSIFEFFFLYLGFSTFFFFLLTRLHQTTLLHRACDVPYAPSSSCEVPLR